MSKYQAYPQYKDSGFGWLGNIPTHWVVSPIKWQIEKVSGGAWGQDPNGVEDTFVLRSTEQTHDGEWKIEDPASRRLSPQEAESTLLKEDDLLMTKSSGSSLHIGKTTIVTGEIAKLRCGYSNFMQRIRIKEDYIARFYWYIFNNELARKQLDYLSSSTTGLANLNATVIGEIICSNPPKVEQEKIVYFLDHETAKIDTLIDKQQQLIQLLKEKRQAVISHAVTKGLNPNAPMRDSGVEWLGEVPEHWEVKRLRYLGTCQNGINIGAEYFGSGFPFVSYGDAYKNEVLPEYGSGLVESTEQDRISYSVHVGDVIFTRTSETVEEIGLSSVCLKAIKDATFAGFLIRFRPNTGELYPCFSKYYFRNILMRTFFIKEMNLVTRASLSQDLLKKLPVPLPPVSEQIEIAEFLDKKSAIFEKLTKNAEAAIELMKERRTALISAAVTGKIDVRDWQVPAPMQSKEAV